VKIPDQGSNIKVICRFRPINKSELQKTTKNFVEFISSNHLLISSDSILSLKQSFTFKKINDEDPEDIYNCSTKSAVYDMVKRYNGTVLCYGQNGFGKTYIIG
jgi:kinesin family protein 5